jgi:hypothetical protein
VSLVTSSPPISPGALTCLRTCDGGVLGVRLDSVINLPRRLIPPITVASSLPFAPRARPAPMQ